MTNAPDTELIKTRFGKMHIPIYPDLISTSLKKYGEWAQQELDILCSLLAPGDTVIDAGAYIGTHSRTFAQQVTEQGKVVAFEPCDNSFLLLQKNAQLCAFNNIEVHHCGLGERLEERDLFLDASTDNQASASTLPTGEVQQVIKIVPLDSFMYEQVRLLKVDVEGMELSLLAGAEATLQRCKPIIFLELLKLSDGAQFLTWAATHGYTAFGINTAAFNINNTNQQHDNIFGHSRETALLLIEKTADKDIEHCSNTLKLPTLNTLDDLAMLLLHKPQYVEEAISSNCFYQTTELQAALPNALKTIELQALLADKDGALADATEAYKALEQRFIEHEQRFQVSRQANEQLLQDKDKALHDATLAYQSVCTAYQAAQQQSELAEPSATQSALETAQQAYKQLAIAFAEKESQITTNIHSYEQLLRDKHAALLDAQQAYTALSKLLSEKEIEFTTALQQHRELLTQKESALQEASEAYLALRKEFDSLHEQHTKLLEQQQGLQQQLTVQQAESAKQWNTLKQAISDKDCALADADQAYNHVMQTLNAKDEFISTLQSELAKYSAKERSDTGD